MEGADDLIAPGASTQMHREEIVVEYSQPSVVQKREMHVESIQERRTG